MGFLDPISRSRQFNACLKSARNLRRPRWNPSWHLSCPRFRAASSSPTSNRRQGILSGAARSLSARYPTIVLYAKARVRSPAAPTAFSLASRGIALWYDLVAVMDMSREKLRCQGKILV